MKVVKDFKQLAGICEGKFLVIHTPKDLCEADKRMPTDSPIRHILVVYHMNGETNQFLYDHTADYYGSFSIMDHIRSINKINLQGTPYYNNSNHWGRSHEDLVKLYNFNVRKKNKVYTTDTYISEEEVHTLSVHLKSFNKALNLAKEMLKEYDVSDDYKDNRKSIPKSCVLHNHGYPYNRIHYIVKGEAKRFNREYQGKPSIESSDKYIYARQFLESSNYFNQYNKDWSVYKVPAKVIKEVHANFEETIKEWKLFKADIGEWWRNRIK